MSPATWQALGVGALLGSLLWLLLVLTSWRKPDPWDESKRWEAERRALDPSRGPRGRV
jgi:hypothetical protein